MKPIVAAVDCRSESLDGLRSLAYSKSEYARTLAATLAYYFSMQRDAVGMVTFEAR